MAGTAELDKTSGAILALDALASVHVARAEHKKVMYDCIALHVQKGEVNNEPQRDHLSHHRCPH